MDFMDFEQILFTIDKNALTHVNHLSLPPFMESFIIHSNFLGLPYIWVLAPFLFNGRKIKEKKRNIVFYFLAFSSVILINVNIKYLILRERPNFTLLRVNPAQSPSFPSGHTSTAWVGATGVNAFFHENKEGWKQKSGKIALYVIAFLVGFARMYVGVHYLFDVTFGALEAYVLTRVFLVYFLMLSAENASLQEAGIIHEYEYYSIQVCKKIMSRVANVLQVINQGVAARFKLYEQLAREVTVLWLKIARKERTIFHRKETAFTVLYGLLLVIIAVLFGLGFLILHANVSVQQFIMFFMSSGENEIEDVLELGQKLFMSSIGLIVFGSSFFALEVACSFKTKDNNE